MAGFTAGAILAGGAAGCTSTQEKSRRLAETGSDAFEAKGVRVAAANPDVQVLSAGIVSDPAGTAAVVQLRNRSRKRFARLPIAIDVRGRGGASVFRNDAAGLEPALATVALLGPGATVTWVHDQLTPSAPARTLVARVGVGTPVNAMPRLSVEGARLDRDSDGPVATGFVRNRSAIAQRDLVVYAVARRGKRVVAAGRGLIPRLASGRRAKFTIFLIGRPAGARLEISVPPTVLRARG